MDFSDSVWGCKDVGGVYVVVSPASDCEVMHGRWRCVRQACVWGCRDGAGSVTEWGGAGMVDVSL